jgi:hypothetical protein
VEVMQNVFTHVLMRLDVSAMRVVDVMRGHVMLMMLRLMMLRVMLMSVNAVMITVTLRVMRLQMTVMTVMLRHVITPD